MNLLKKNNLIILAIVVLAIVGFAIFKYSFQAPKKIELKEIDYKGNAVNFFSRVKQDSEKWQDKVVIITGNITHTDNKGITLENTIYCQLRKQTTNQKLQTKQLTTLKGRVIGYDDLLEELKLDQCIILP